MARKTEGWRETAPALGSFLWKVSGDPGSGRIPMKPVALPGTRVLMLAGT